MPRDRFRKLVNGQKEATPRLPILHSTDVFTFRDALDDNQLKSIEKCDVFGEHLVYFFYGRPSFRVNGEEPPTSLSHYLPVCMLFKCEDRLKIKRVFPFDSGGFQREMYAATFHKRTTKDAQVVISLEIVSDIDLPIPTMQRTRDYYRAIGYDKPYRWAHNTSAPFQPLTKPLAAKLGILRG